MSGMLASLGAVAFGLILYLLAFVLLPRWFPCTCGRSVPPYFYVKHGRSGVLLTQALMWTGFAALSVITISWFGVIVNTGLAVWMWFVYAKHESGKWKRRAAKAAGRIGFNQHGRLVIERG